MGDINSDDFYKILGVDKSADEKEISKAYKKAAIKWHPDKNQDKKELAEQNFKKVSEAYEVLSDPEKRQVYDNYGKEGLQGGAPGAGGAPFGPGMSSERAHDIFRMFFGGGDPFGDSFGGMQSGTHRVYVNGQPGMSGMGSMNGIPPEMADMLFSGMGGGVGMNGMGGMASMGSMRRSRSGRHGQRHDTIPNGSTVKIHGLQSAAQNNGRSGKVIGFDGAKERYLVEVESGETLALRGSNIQQLVSCEITNLSGSPAYNGKQGQITGWLDGANTGRYEVNVGGKMVGLQCANVVLPVGTRVVVQGLSQVQYNGLRGQITAFDRVAMRYVVRLQNEKQLKLKLENVKA
mmetsp:Transcript_6967/g.25656  ORF Transcript_6967/g.25656 Transcript_6967/m.25656 type:complete len:347 (-) Transcript_6967:2130-3170(-)|eukprot:scaffold1766_cov401-Prasinococcus_capsulatus_cf.AAC.39